MSTFKHLQREHAGSLPFRNSHPGLLRASQSSASNSTIQKASSAPETAFPHIARSLHQISLFPPEKHTTGLPDTLKAGIEHLSGLNMDDVHVHYHSPEPARFQALAFTQGTHIYLRPEQEKHLAHEAWHVVQQKQGRVHMMKREGDAMINTDPALEAEASRMGALGEQSTHHPTRMYPQIHPIQMRNTIRTSLPVSNAPVQMVKSISEMFPPVVGGTGRGLSPKQIFTQYIDYLIQVANNLHIKEVTWKLKLNSVNVIFQNAKRQIDASPLKTSQEILEARQYFDPYMPFLRELEDVAKAETKNVVTPTVLPQGAKKDQIYLYRRMHSNEAATILDTYKKNGKVVEAAMAHFQNKGYKKYFTTSPQHSQEFTNQNSVDSSNEVVLRFTLNWNDYWEYLQKYAVPNQKTGVFVTEETATMNQEKIVKGNLANFRTDEQVQNVLEKGEHHNIGVGHGNVSDFDKLIISVEAIPIDEL